MAWNVVMTDVVGYVAPVPMAIHAIKGCVWRDVFPIAPGKPVVPMVVAVPVVNVTPISSVSVPNARARFPVPTSSFVPRIVRVMALNVSINAN